MNANEQKKEKMTMASNYDWKQHANDLEQQLADALTETDKWRKVANSFSKGVSCCALCLEHAQLEYGKLINNG